MGKFNWGSALGGMAGGALGAFVPALQPYQAALSAGGGALGAAATKGNVGAGALTGLATGGIGNTIGGGISGMMNNGSSGNSLWDSFSSGAGNGWRSYMQSIPGMGGFGTSNPTGALAKMTTSSSVPAPSGVASAGSNSPMMQGFNSSSSNSPLGGQMGSGLGNIQGSPTMTPGLTGDVSSSLAASNPGNMSTIAGSFGKNAPGQSLTQGASANALTDNWLAANGLPSDAPVTRSFTNPVSKAPTAVTAAAGGDKTPMNFFKSMAPGMALSTLGTLAAPTPKPVDYSSQIADFKNQMTSGANPEALQMGLAGAKEALALDPTLSAADTKAITDVRDQAWKPQEQQLIGEWQAAHPGADYANDSAFSQNMANAHSQFMAGTQGQISSAQLQKQNQVENQKLQAVSSALGVNGSALSAAATALGYSIDQAITNATMDATFANRWTQLAQSMGNTGMMAGAYSTMGKAA